MTRPRKRRAPVPIGEVIGRVLAQGLEHAPPRVERATPRVFAAFAGLGPSITAHAEPILFRAGVLTVVVDESAWLTELSFQREQILGAINATLGKDTVRDLRMRHGALPRKAPPPPKPKPPILSVDQQAAVTSLGETIADPELRELVMRAARWSIGTKPQGIPPDTTRAGPLLAHAAEPAPTRSPSPAAPSGTPRGPWKRRGGSASTGR